MRLLLMIAILPGAFLLKYIYDKDKLDKESKKLLTRLLIFGALAAIPAFIWETVGDYVLGDLYYSTAMEDMVYSLLNNFLIVGIAEETCKYLMMRFNTWKNPEFNCSFDGIVYAVYASLGFAILENILYVFEYGVVTGLVRAFSSIPGHAFFGVLMGVFYGKAREAANRGDKADRIQYKFLAIAVPALVHGLYDFCCDYIIAWLLVLAALYSLGIFIVKRSSESDAYISSYRNPPEADPNAAAPAVPAVPADPAAFAAPGMDDLTAQPPVQTAGGRYCPKCGTLNDGRFCPVCGAEMPQ